MRWSALDSGRLKAVATETLTAVEQSFTDAGISLPDRRFISNNSVAYDCEQCSVEVGGLGIGTATADTPVGLKVPKVPNAIIMVALIRDCQPVSEEGGAPPTVEAIEAASDALLADATVLIGTFLKKGAVPSCRDLIVQTCMPYGPEGGVAGWVLTIKVGF